MNGSRKSEHNGQLWASDVSAGPSYQYKWKWLIPHWAWHHTNWLTVWTIWMFFFLSTFLKESSHECAFVLLCAMKIEKKKKHWYGDADCGCVTHNSWAGCTVECQELQPLQNSHPLTIFLRIKENRQFPSALNGCFSGFMQPPLFIYFYAVSDCCVYRSKMSRADKRFAVIGAGSTDSIKSSVFVGFWLKIKSNLRKEKAYSCYLGRDPEEESSFFGGG